MGNSLKKRGQKFLKQFSRLSLKASEEGKEHIKENLIGRISHVSNIRLLILEWSLLVCALIMLAVTQAFWFGDSYAANTFADGGSYVEGTIGKVNSLNPLFATTSSEKTLSRLLFATLSTVDYSGHVGMGLAKSITASENGKVWTLKLREGLKWSDGEPLTNEDVIFTTKLIQNQAVGSIYSSNLTNVKISENEDGEIVFVLPSAYADFMSALNFPIVPKHELDDADPRTLVEDDFSTTPVTSGAFTLNAVQASEGDERIVYLSPNENYYRGEVLVSSFAVHTFSDSEKIIDALNSGLITASAELSGAETEKVTSATMYRKESSLNSGAFIFFNTTGTTFKNTELRRAIREGINLETIRAAAPGTTALDFPLLSSAIMLSKYPSLPEYNLEAAKGKVLELIGEGVKVRIATVRTGYLPEVAEALKNELGALGIEAEVAVHEENQEFISNIVAKRNYDILVYEIELGADPDPLPYYHSSQASSSGLNLSNYRNALVDDLLIGARETLNDDLRAAKYESFLNYINDDVPTIGLYQTNLTYFYNKNVRTFGDNVRLVTALDRFSDILNFSAAKETKNKTP